MTLAIIILNWNGKQDTLACLQTLTSPNITEIIVVDNGSSDDSVSAISSAFPRVTLIPTGTNLGYAGGNNVGIAYALEKGHELILLLNNDTLVEPDMVEAFLDEAKRYPEAGIFGGFPLRMSNPDQLDHLGGVWNPKKAAFDLIGLKAPKTFTYSGELTYVCGCSILIRSSVFERLGLLEEAFFLYWEEADFCARAKRAGFGIRVCEGARLLHKVSASFTGGSPMKAYYYMRGRMLWIKRNCSKGERWRLFSSVIVWELIRLWRLTLIKGLELRVLKRWGSGRNLKEKEKKLAEYRAALRGFTDYRQRKFGIMV